MTNDFNDINKRYTSQLVQVKVGFEYFLLPILKLKPCVNKISDMANSDLEKYAKALDKYVGPTYCMNSKAEQTYQALS